MLGNYLVTAWRHLARHKLYSGINIAGFAVGLTCCIVILAFVRGELSYDRFIPDHQRTYRLIATFHNQAGPTTTANVMGPVVPVLAEQIEGIESASRMREQEQAVRQGDVQFYERITYADGNFLQTVALPLLAGDPASAIARPDTVVISEAMAGKYFPGEDPLGKTIMVEGETPLLVTGILRDIPENSQFRIQFLTNYATGSYPLPPDEILNGWFNGNHYAYVRLKPGADRAGVVAGFAAVEDAVFPNANTDAGPMKGGTYVDLSLQPVTDVHLHSAGYGNLKPAGDIDQVYTFGAIALLILLIASINFVVLTTARSGDRAREIGMRKVLGSSRQALVAQFLIETALVTFIAFVIALSMAELVTPLVRDYLQRPFDDGSGEGASWLGGQLAIVAAVGLLAGFYPALVLSALKPVQALKGKAATGRGWLRTIMVVVQFAISIALLIVTAVMLAQTEFARSVRPGFSVDDVIVLQGVDVVPEAVPTLLERLRADSSVTAVAGQQLAPGDLGFEGRNFRVPDRPDLGDLVMESLSVDFDFFELYRVRVLAGRSFDRSRAGDLLTMPSEAAPEVSGTAVITQAALKPFGFDTPEQAIGKTLERFNPDNGQLIHLTIVGVVDDFQRRTVRNRKNPVVFYVDPGQFWSISVKAAPEQAAAAMTHVRKVWGEVVPNLPVRAGHLDQRFHDLYDREERQGAVFGSFALLAVSVACLGLFGLAAFTVERRTKEIGIRKVMGATTPRIVRLLLWQFSLPVLAANAIAWPLGWYIAQDWLTPYRERIEITPVYFIAASAIVLGLAAFTVAGHAIRVARAKPVLALRYE